MNTFGFKQQFNHFYSDGRLDDELDDDEVNEIDEIFLLLKL